MSIFTKAAAITALIGACNLAMAQNVTIVYPIAGQSYPITDPAPGALQSAYIGASFSVTCSGGPHSVKWGFDGTSLGTAEFYDQISEQQVWKLPGGGHVFYVDAGRCGAKEIKFSVGP